MPKAVFLVLSNPSNSDRDNEFNEWYNATHAPDVLKGVTGAIGATRYRISDTQFLPQNEPPKHQYLAIYEIDADNLEAARDQLYGLQGNTFLSDAMDWPSVSGLVFEQITERLVPE
jgi:hypothetical protein